MTGEDFVLILSRPILSFEVWVEVEVEAAAWPNPRRKKRGATLVLVPLTAVSSLTTFGVALSSRILKVAMTSASRGVPRWPPPRRSSSQVEF